MVTFNARVQRCRFGANPNCIVYAKKTKAVEFIRRLLLQQLFVLETSCNVFGNARNPLLGFPAALTRASENCGQKQRETQSINI